MSLREIVERLDYTNKLLNPARKTYKDSGTGAISKVTTVSGDYPTKKWKLRRLEATFSTAPTTSENLTVTKSASHSNRPDTVLFSQDPSATSASSILQIWEDGVDMEPGDEVTIAYTNTDNNTVKVEVEAEIVND